MQDVEDVGAIEVWLGTVLPQPYRDFLDTQQEALPVGDLVLLYGRDDFRERNETYETKTYCPGHVTIGDGGGGQQFLLALQDGRISLVDAGSMSPADAEPVAADLGAWRAAGCPLPDEYQVPVASKEFPDLLGNLGRPGRRK